MPPTGRRFEGIDEVYIFRVSNGKLAGVTAVVEDNLKRMLQLGLDPLEVEAESVTHCLTYGVVPPRLPSLPRHS